MRGRRALRDNQMGTPLLVLMCVACSNGGAGGVASGGSAAMKEGAQGTRTEQGMGPGGSAGAVSGGEGQDEVVPGSGSSGSAGGNSQSTGGGGAVASNAGGANGGSSGVNAGETPSGTSSPGTGGTVASWPEVHTVKIDLDTAGRPTDEVTDPAYTSWVPDNAAAITNTVDGITFEFSVAAGGDALKSDWYKAGVQAPNYARLVSDGLIVDGGEGGAAIQLQITGLPAGPHTLLTYHNMTVNPDTNTVAPISISVGGSEVINGLEPSVRALSSAEAVSSYLSFEATEGQPVSVLYQADVCTSASNKNVILNGFEIDTPNAAFQATTPVPGDGDEHVDADDGTLTLSWTAARNAASHDVYFGEDPQAVYWASTASPEFQGAQTTTSFPALSLGSTKTYFWRVDELGEDGVLTKGNVWYFRPRQLAFNGAEGYGRFARGGRGGAVVHVTNLNDAGTGSFREAVENDIGPRTIVFDVGGLIALESRLTLTSTYVTVAGQTAPGKGITIARAPFGMSGAEDCIIRHLRVRLGGGPTFDGMGMSGSDHSIIDHCSISWTIDEAFSSRSAHNITLQRTLISEALNIAGHQNYAAGTAHGYAASISGDVGSFHHNLLAHCEGRNWSLAGGLDGDGNYSGRLDLFNNVVYNWGNRSTDGGAHEVNFVNNYYKPGAATEIFVALNAQYDSFPGTQQYYVEGNVMPGYFSESNQTAGRQYTGTPDGYSPWVNSSFFPSYATVQTASDAYKSVLSDVGCSQPVFDDHDTRIVKETLNGTYTYRGSVSGSPGLPDDEADVGGYEDYPTTSRDTTWDTDGDGLANWWEAEVGLNPNSAPGDFSDANADPDADGFTNLDDYLEWMAKPHVFTAPGAEVEIDLTKQFAGFTESPVYSASGATGATVTVSSSTATFTPAGCGFGSILLKVTDGTSATMTKEFVFFTSGC